MTFRLKIRRGQRLLSRKRREQSPMQTQLQQHRKSSHLQLEAIKRTANALWRSQSQLCRHSPTHQLTSKLAHGRESPGAQGGARHAAHRLSYAASARSAAMLPCMRAWHGDLHSWTQLGMEGGSACACIQSCCHPCPHLHVQGCGQHILP